VREARPASALAIVTPVARSSRSPASRPGSRPEPGALGVRPGGRNDYGSRVEDRPVLGGDGRQPALYDIARATRLSRAVTIAAAVACAAIALARGRGAR
jgi:cobalamin biosynthesis protein CobD/CbiB